MAAITETVLGVFAHVDTTVRALEELRAKGYHDLTVYTPIPVHEIEDVLERDRPVSRVRIFTLLGALLGLAPAWPAGAGDRPGGRGRGGGGVKPVSPLVLLCSGGAAGLMGAISAYRGVRNRTQTPRIVRGERVCAMPAGVVPRGAEAVIPKE